MYQFNTKNVNVLPPPKYSVLFVIVDDLRPELGCYGKSNIFSPEIDICRAPAADHQQSQKVHCILEAVIRLHSFVLNW